MPTLVLPSVITSLVSGTVSLGGGASSVGEALGSDLTKYVDMNSNSVIEATFTDNYVVNASGADLVVFEMLSNPDSFDMAIALGLGGGTFTSYRTYATANTGYTEGGLQVNAVSIDLSDYSLAAGTLVDTLRIAEGGNLPEIGGVAALNSVAIPEPATMAALALGLSGLAIRRRRRNH